MRYYGVPGIAYLRRAFGCRASSGEPDETPKCKAPTEGVEICEDAFGVLVYCTLRSNSWPKVSRGELAGHHHGRKKHKRFLTPIEAALYRIVQEALTNFRIHAKPCHVIMGMQREAEAFHCLAKDDGIGFETKAPICRKCQQGPNCWAFKDSSVRQRTSDFGMTTS